MVVRGQIWQYLGVDLTVSGHCGARNWTCINCLQAKYLNLDFVYNSLCKLLFEDSFLVWNKMNSNVAFLYMWIFKKCFLFSSEFSPQHCKKKKIVGILYLVLWFLIENWLIWSGNLRKDPSLFLGFIVVLCGGVGMVFTLFYLVILEFLKVICYVCPLDSSWLV